ncbi:unnamed protein product [Linum trigynum]|uniref:Uncharacterized protein n=1 Tax=Linum trigynum TaxID=586398 RepID=A0AAV2CGN2_9ROSI
MKEQRLLALATRADGHTQQLATILTQSGAVETRLDGFEEQIGTLNGQFTDLLTELRQKGHHAAAEDVRLHLMDQNVNRGLLLLPNRGVEPMELHGLGLEHIEFRRASFFH